MATGEVDPELMRCCISAWAVGQIAAFQHTARKFANERHLQFAVVSTSLCGAESRAAQHFLTFRSTQHSTPRGAPSAPPAAGGGGRGAAAAGAAAAAHANRERIAWVLWRPSHRQRCRLQPGPALSTAVGAGLETGRGGDGAGVPGWAAAVNVLAFTTQEAARAAENAVEAALSGSGDWEAAESLFSL